MTTNKKQNKRQQQKINEVKKKTCQLSNQTTHRQILLDGHV